MRVIEKRLSKRGRHATADAPIRWAGSRRGILLAAACVLPTLIAGQQGATVNFRDKVSNMTLRGFVSFSLKTDAEGVLSFDGSGSPATGEWRSQELRIDASKWDGTARKDASGAYLLETVRVSGNVKAVSKRDDGEVVLTSPTVRYAAKANRFDLEGGMTVTQIAARSTLFARSASASIVLYETRPKGAPSAIRSATLPGPVHVELRSERDVVEGEEKTVRTLTLVADAGRLEYDAAARTVTLTGGVKVVGDDLVMAGDAQGSRAVIRLGEDGRPIGLEMVGEPGVSHFTERRGGGAR